MNVACPKYFGIKESLLKRVVSEFFHSINHGQDIFWGNIVHYRMYSPNHAAASWTENLYHAPHFLANFLNAAVGQNTVCIDAAAKNDVVSESFLE